MAALRTTKYSYNCAIPLCVTKGSNSFHTFPSNSVQREKWLKICQIRVAKSHQRVCQKHFEKSDYYTQGGIRSRLKPGVVPSLCLPFVPDIEESMDQIEHVTSPVTEVRSRPSI
jgi:hypothetical protein